FFFFFVDTPTTVIYTLSLHRSSDLLLSRGFAALAGEADDLRPALDKAVVGERLGWTLLALAQRVKAVAKFASRLGFGAELRDELDRKSTRLNSSHDQISYAVFCLKK